MKGLLISPSEKKFLTHAGDRPPLGLLYISAALTKNNIKHSVIDLNHYRWVDLIDKVEREKPDFVGISCVSSPTIKQLQTLTRKIKPYVGKIIAGGPHITQKPSDLECLIDSIVYSYGERGIVRALKEDNLNIYEPIDINEYPIPNRLATANNKYTENLFGLKSATMVTSRGCKSNCSFCSKINNKLLYRDIDNIEEELRQIKYLNYQAVHIVDENFTGNRKHSEGVMNLMKKYNLKYRADVRADTITDNTAKLMSETGCLMAAIGVESGDDRVLYNINKKTNTKKIEDAVENLSKYNVNTKGFFIFGLPYQDEKSCEKTIEFAKKLKTKGMVTADFYSLIPFPGTPIERLPSHYGVTILTKDYRKYLQANKDVVEPVIETKWLTKDKIKHYCGRANKEING